MLSDQLFSLFVRQLLLLLLLLLLLQIIIYASKIDPTPLSENYELAGPQRLLRGESMSLTLVVGTKY